MWKAILLSVVIFSPIISGEATECERIYKGTCTDLLSGSCKAGEKQVMSHCGFMQFCCFPDPALALQPTTATGTEKCGTPLVKATSRIMGGTKVEPGAYPWQVSLRENGIHMCGGSLIDRQWVLTAAHCFEDDHRSKNWTVAVGYHDSYVLYSSQIHKVKQIISHYAYDPDRNPNDIALVQLDKPVNISGKYVRTICLPDPSFDLSQGKVCTVTGWGDNKYEGNSSRYMEKIELPVVSNSQCRSAYIYSEITSSMICAGSRSGGKDSCQGDSGGPFECESGGVYVLGGIVSRGYKCGVAGYPGMYTKVTSFLPWIHTYV